MHDCHCRTEASPRNCNSSARTSKTSALAWRKTSRSSNNRKLCSAQNSTDCNCRFVLFAFGVVRHDNNCNVGSKTTGPRELALVVRHQVCHRHWYIAFADSVVVACLFVFCFCFVLGVAVASFAIPSLIPSSESANVRWRLLKTRWTALLATWQTPSRSCGTSSSPRENSSATCRSNWLR